LHFQRLQACERYLAIPYNTLECANYRREDDIQACELLMYSGGPRAWNEVFNTNKSVCPLTRDDHRWLKAPISVRRPRFDDVERVLNTVSHGEIAWEPGTGEPDAAEPDPHRQD